MSPAARARRASSSVDPAAAANGDAETLDGDGEGEAEGSASAAPRRKLYLQGDLRVIFPPRRPDEDAEALHVQQDAPLLEADAPTPPPPRLTRAAAGSV